MSGFLGIGSSSSSSASSPSDMAARKEAVMNNIRSELALVNAQQLMNTTNEKCFEKCVLKPSGSLSRSEETCLSNCLDRYMEAFNIVSKTYVARLGKERLDAAQLGSTI